MKLEVKIRYTNVRGRREKCVAPFINDWNVWDIPIKQWTPEVQQAVKWAYQLGVEHALSAAMSKQYAIQTELVDSSKFPEPKEDK